ncbi:MAG: endolytic transglycosylase MltG [Propionibacteriaceae bacterium]|nr:endolytic transglycosylase MltG [Propionibacteriaceae bacterium]
MSSDSQTWAKREKARRIKSGIAVAVSLAILIGGLWFASTTVYGFYIDWRETDDYVVEGDETTQIVIPEGATLGEIADICVTAGVVKSAATFETEAAKNPDAVGIQPGRYNIRLHIPAADAITDLLNPDNRVVYPVAVPEGMRYSEIIPIIADSTKEMPGGGWSVEDLTAILVNDPAAYGLPDIAGGEPEGFLFPATYDAPDPFDPVAMYSMMTQRFNQMAEEENLIAGTDALNQATGLQLTPYQVVIVASIIEKEVFAPEYQAKVARVIYNRLTGHNWDGPKYLGLDSTLHYALDRTGQANLGDGDQDMDSPYNTYNREGLPPTAISNPGQTAVHAALNPEPGDWIFYTTINLETGETLFETSSAEHDVNVEIYQQWCRDNPDICQ